MSGYRIMGRFGTDKRELAEKLREEGEDRIARKVERGDCLGFNERHRAEEALGRRDLSKYSDYSIQPCYDEENPND